MGVEGKKVMKRNFFIIMMTMIVTVISCSWVLVFSFFVFRFSYFIIL